MTAVVVPVYNGAEVLPLTVSAVLALQGVHEIVWVDDGSTDSTPGLLGAATEADPRARVVRLPENRGRSAARNAGVLSCTADTLVFFDADVEPPPDAASALVNALASDGAIASVARFQPVLTQPDEPYQDYAAHFPRGPAAGASADVPIDWRFFLTGACALRRADLGAVGGFREDVVYGEDVALGDALREIAPRGLRLAPPTARLYDVGTLDEALGRAAEYGRGLRVHRTSGPALTDRLDRLRLVAPAVQAVAIGLRGLVDVLPPGRTRRRCVRYLLGLAVLRAYHRA